MKNCKNKYRIYALIVDLSIIFLGLYIIFMLSGTSTLWIDMVNGNDIAIDSYELLYILRIFIIEVTFIILYTAGVPALFNGQTLGMYIFKIQFVNSDGSKILFGSLFVRQFAVNTVVVVFTLGLSLILSICLVFYRKDRSSLADLVAHSKVIDKLDY